MEQHTQTLASMVIIVSGFAVPITIEGHRLHEWIGTAGALPQHAEGT